MPNYDSLVSGFVYPDYNCMFQFLTSGTISTAQDAVDEKVAIIGHIYMKDRTASAKTISAAGGGSVSFVTASNSVFDDAASSITMGFQGMSASGPPAQPDGSFTVSKV